MLCVPDCAKGRYDSDPQTTATSYYVSVTGCSETVMVRHEYH